jgi:hypothetical protein
MTSYARIDYGNGRAQLWGTFDAKSVNGIFHKYAGQCFGIRKSLEAFILLEFRPDTPLPEPWNTMPGAATILKHSGDTIVWNKAGEKIKSEWD